MGTPYSVIRREVAPSTQDIAREAFTAEPVLVVADRQQSGRGRSGSQWDNAPRAVAMSLAVRPSWPVDRWASIPLVAGVAVTRVVGGQLKWPNDVLHSARKTGGILVEAAGSGPVVIGVGLNLWWPDPPAGYGSIYDDDPGASAADAIAGDWAHHMLELLDLPPGDWPRGEYVSRCDTIGSAITWHPTGKGVAVGIAADGGLEVETDHGRVTLRSGEIRHVRPDR